MTDGRLCAQTHWMQISVDWILLSSWWRQTFLTHNDRRGIMASCDVKRKLFSMRDKMWKCHKNVPVTHGCLCQVLSFYSWVKQWKSTKKTVPLYDWWCHVIPLLEKNCGTQKKNGIWTRVFKQFHSWHIPVMWYLQITNWCGCCFTRGN